MPTTTASKFKHGDRVVFIQDNSDGGGRFGTKGDYAVVEGLGQSGWWRIRLDNPRSGSRSWRAHVSDLQLIPEILEYDPTQQGDTDDDI